MEKKKKILEEKKLVEKYEAGEQNLEKTIKKLVTPKKKKDQPKK